jgi:SAM-dependent methyltransferase
MKKNPASVLFQEIQTIRSTSSPEQWKSLASVYQYKLPYVKTLQYLNGTNNVLDWGCGNGHFSFFLVHQGCRTTGYSFEPYPEILKREPSFTFQSGSSSDAVHLPFSDSSFEAVFSIGVLEHVHERGGDQKASVREIDRILRKGGYFYCFHLPNRFSLVEFFVRGINRLFHKNLHEHSRRFDRKRITSLLEGTSFKIVEWGRYNFIPRNSLSKLPRFLCNTEWGVQLIEGLDAGLTFLFPFLCQNWYVIIKKD